MTDTSIQAFCAAKESGFLSDRQDDVVQYMLNFPLPEGISQRDVDRFHGDTSSSLHPRFAELEDSGVIKCVGTKADQVSGNKVKSYKLIKAPDAKVRRKQKTVRLSPGEVASLLSFDSGYQSVLAKLRDFQAQL